MPDGDDDPLKLADRLSQMALSNGSGVALDEAQQPWLAAKAPGEALRIVEDILAKRPDLRVTGGVGVGGQGGVGWGGRGLNGWGLGRCLRRRREWGAALWSECHIIVRCSCQNG